MDDGRQRNENDAKPKSEEYDGWGFDLFPERRGSLKTTMKNVLLKGRGNENLERIKCENKVASCIKKSKIALHLCYISPINTCLTTPV